MDEKTVFTIEGDLQKQLLRFVEEHKCCRSLTVGEKFCFTFVPSTIGLFTSVSCTCGKAIDLSDI